MKWSAVPSTVSAPLPTLSKFVIRFCKLSASSFIEQFVCVIQQRTGSRCELLNSVSGMTFDSPVVCQCLTTGRACGKRYKLRRKQCIGAERGSYVRRHRWDFLVEADCHEHRVLFIRQRL